jgi:hypothetical protein
MKLIDALCLAAAFFLFGCDGGGGNGRHDADVIVDGVDDGGAEIPTEADGIEDPAAEDVAAEDSVDVPPEDVTETVEEEIIITPGEGQPYQCETAGGAFLESDNYRLEVFIAPVRPIGSVSSPNYQLKLGPGSTRTP